MKKKFRSWLGQNPGRVYKIELQCKNWYETYIFYCTIVFVTLNTPQKISLRVSVVTKKIYKTFFFCVEWCILIYDSFGICQRFLDLVNFNAAWNFETSPYLGESEIKFWQKFKNFVLKSRPRLYLLGRKLACRGSLWFRKRWR